MGTNYYAIEKKPSLYKKPIHIGKSSCGWKFLFRGYQDYNLEDFACDYRGSTTININSIDEWKDYLKSDKVIILDEYDQEISYDDFFKLVEDKQSEHNKDDFKYTANINGYRFNYRDFS